MVIGQPFLWTIGHQKARESRNPRSRFLRQALQVVLFLVFYQPSRCLDFLAAVFSKCFVIFVALGSFHQGATDISLSDSAPLPVSS